MATYWGGPPNGKKQNADISWKTVLNKMVQKNAFAEEEVNDD